MTMKRLRTTLIFLAALLVSSALNGQDSRTIGTRVADLLARMPAGNKELAGKLMEEMYSMGEEGWDLICTAVVPAGSGDDVAARYAINTLTTYLSGDTGEERRKVWEQQCIRFMGATSDREVSSFFMRQLWLTGSDAAVDALREYAGTNELCDDAVMALQAIGSQAALDALSDALSRSQCPCAAQVMIALSEGHYSGATDSYLEWNRRGRRAERAAALHALAASGVPEAREPLLRAAEEARYQWDRTGAVQSLLLYARTIGLAGEVKEMKKITDLVLSVSNTPATAGQRVGAMSVLVEVTGDDALKMLLNAADDPDASVRGGALRLTASLSGPDVTKKLISKYPKMSPEAKPGILIMLGERGDVQAVPLVMKAMDDPSAEIAAEAFTALARLKGKEAVDPIISWILNHDSEAGHAAAASVLTTILDSTGVKKVVSYLPGSEGLATVTLIRLLAWSGDTHYFKTVFPYTDSPDMAVSAAAKSALASLASYTDQPEIIALLDRSSERAETTELQRAVIAAAMRNKNKEERSDILLDALDKGSDKMRLLPLLSATGGQKALKRVAWEFENGDARTRDVCFGVLANWTDHSAAPVLLEICRSGNKTFGIPAFDAYLEMVSVASITPERKLLMIKDIAPLAAPPDARISMLELAASLNIRQSQFFVSSYGDDPSEEVRYAASEALESMNLPEDEYFVPMFNGKDLAGWQGLVGNPLTRATMKPKELAEKQKEADSKMTGSWSVSDGMIRFNGTGDNLCSVKEYDDFELYVDWRITKDGDSGIYLRGTPQVQIWDTSRTDVGAQAGSGGLYNNEENPSAPLKVADNPVGEWNTFRIVMTGQRVSVWLNGEVVTDDVIMENYWDRSIPIFEKGPVELQAHGTDLCFRDIYIREIPPVGYRLTEKEKEEGFVLLFNGRNLDGWTGDKVSYKVENGMIVIDPGNDSGGNLYTEKEYSDFVFRFEFQLTPGANNGLGIRTPVEGDAAYVGMELQILDNTAAVYADLRPYQYHGSVYGVIAARRGFLRPIDEWNYEEVTVRGTRIRVELNGAVIVNGDIAEARDKGTPDGADHPGLKNSKGHIGFLGHGSVVRFRNIRIKEL